MPQSIPWEGKLSRSSGSWSLDYVAQGNLGYGELSQDALPGIYAGRIPDRLRGSHGWYPKDRELWGKLPVERDVNWILVLASAGALLPVELAGGQPSWETYAGVIESVKASQGGSVSEYNRRLSALVSRIDDLERRHAALEQSGEARDFRHEAKRAAERQAKAIERRLERTMKIQMRDQTRAGLLSHIEVDLAQGAAGVRVHYSGDLPSFASVDPLPEDLMQWVPASSLSEIEARAEKVAGRLSSHESTLKQAKDANERRLEAFERGLKPGDFSVSIQDLTTRAEGYNAELERPDIRLTDQGWRFGGPVVLVVHEVELARYFNPVGIRPREATLRAGPGADQRAIGTVSGTEVGFGVVSENGWTRIHNDKEGRIGWVRTSLLGTPEEAAQAQIDRRLQQVRPDGAPTETALKTLVQLEYARANRRRSGAPLSDLIGEVELKRFRLIACEAAVGEPGYVCDVSGQAETSNVGVQAMQRLCQLFAGDCGRGGRFEFQEQLRAVRGPDDRWEVVEAESMH